MLRVKDWTLLALLCVHANAASVYTCKEEEKVSSVLQSSDYFVCKDGDLVKKTCPTGELYDSDAETCRDAHKMDFIDVLLGRHHQHSLNGRRSKEDHTKDSNNTSSGETRSKSNEWSLESTTRSTTEVSSDDPSTTTSQISTNGTEVTPSTTQTTTSLTETTINPVIGCQGTCPANNIEPTYNPHSDCSKFCECINGFPFVLDCPPGLHFDPSEIVCDWPENVDCPYYQYFT